MSNTHIYYMVGPDAPVRPLIQQCLDQIRAANRAAQEFKDCHRAKKAMIYQYTGELAGLIFENNDTPAGWRRDDNGLCVPDRRSKAGRAIAAEVERLPKGIDSMGFTFRLSQMTGVDMMSYEDAVVYYATFGLYGDTMLLGIPKLVEFRPEGCTELLQSEVDKITHQTTKAA